MPTESRTQSYDGEKPSEPETTAERRESPGNFYEAPQPKLDPSQFSRTEDEESGFQEEGAELTVSLVKCPPQGLFVRVHPSIEYQWPRILLIESRATKELILATPQVRDGLRGDKFLGEYYLFYGITEHGKHFGWAIKTGGSTPYSYTESGRMAATAASRTWCRVDIENFKYKVTPAESAEDFPEPGFAKESPGEVFNAIFYCLVAYNMEHPAVKQLKGRK